MSRAFPRITAAAGAAALALSVTACNDDQEATETSSASGTAAAQAGCAGPNAPSFSGDAQAYDSRGRVEDNKALGVQASTPTLSKSNSGADGWSIATVDVSASVVTNGVYAVSPDSFILVDQRGKQCTRPRTNAAPTPLTVQEIDEKKPATGTVAFLVPTGADLSKYSVLYSSDGTGRTAQVKWATSGSAPTGSTNGVCSTEPSPMTLRDKSKRQAYGASMLMDSSGDIGTRVLVEKPVVRQLQPSDRHPNDVDGLAVKVRVQAVGSSAFVSRDMFQLIDGKGNLCQYSELGTEGENLTSDVVPAGKVKTYILIFWAPKGAAEKVTDTQVLFRSDGSGNTVDAAWYDKKENPPVPSAAPTSSAPSASSAASPSATSSSAAATTRPSASASSTP